MRTTEIQQIGDGLPRHRTKFVVAYYLLTILTGAFVLFFRSRLAFAADLIVAVFFIAATALFYDLSKARTRAKGVDPMTPRNRRGRSTIQSAGHAEGGTAN